MTINKVTLCAKMELTTHLCQSDEEGEPLSQVLQGASADGLRKNPVTDARTELCVTGKGRSRSVRVRREPLAMVELIRSETGQKL